METPKDFGARLQQNWVKTVNLELTRLRSEIEAAAPEYTGALKKSWQLKEANLVNNQGSLSTFNPYFPNVESGLPKGYVMGSTERERLQGWVIAKMGAGFLNAPFIVSRIADKYQAIGRKGTSYVGAAPKTVPKKLGDFPREPVAGGLIDQAFRRLDKEFR